MSTIKYILAPIVVAMVFLLGAIEDRAMLGKFFFDLSKDKLMQHSFVPLQYERVKDTFYVLGDSYIEISLDKQIAYLSLRSGEKLEYKISSGNPNISKGISTTEGIFTVQSKSQKAISKQFNNAELHYWIGFNGNIGFHGLSGNGYYGFLGSRPSSHGCVRIGREDGKDLYSKVTRGTPVMVYHSKPARALAFADWAMYSNSNSILISKDGRDYNSLIQRRLDNLYNGDVYIKNKQKIFFDGTTILRYSRFKSGDSDKIAEKHKLPLYSTDFQTMMADNLRLAKVSINQLDSTKQSL